MRKLMETIKRLEEGAGTVKGKEFVAWAKEELSSADAYGSEHGFNGAASREDLKAAYRAYKKGDYEQSARHLMQSYSGNDEEINYKIATIGDAMSDEIGPKGIPGFGDNPLAGFPTIR